MTARQHPRYSRAHRLWTVLAALAVAVLAVVKIHDPATSLLAPEALVPLVLLAAAAEGIRRTAPRH
jgi:hypothetical protein